MVKNEDVNTLKSTLSPREQALVALATSFALDQGGADADCAIVSAKEEGFTDTEVSRIRSHIEKLRDGASKEEESLASLLVSAAKSSCCS